MKQMHPTDYFRLAFAQMLETTGKRQIEVADYLGATPRSVNDYLKGRVNYSEQRRESLAEFFETTYIAMLNLGYKIGSGESVPENPPSPQLQLPQEQNSDSDRIKLLNEHISLLKELAESRKKESELLEELLATKESVRPKGMKDTS